DRLAFAVGIGREIDVLLALRRLAQLGDDLPLAVNDLILGGEILLDVDAELALGQIDDVPHRRLHLVVATEVFGERPRLGGRLDDDEMLGHQASALPALRAKHWPGNCRTTPRSSSTSRASSTVPAASPVRAMTSSTLR